MLRILLSLRGFFIRGYSELAVSHDEVEQIDVEIVPYNHRMQPIADKSGSG
jgi:hypothetical protein